MPQDHMPIYDTKEAPVTVTQADGWVVVSFFRDPRCVKPPYAGAFEYDHFDSVNDAYDRYADYERGEWSGYEPRGIFPVRDGLPFGPPLPLSQIGSAVREGQQAARDDARHTRFFGRTSL